MSFSSELDDTTSLRRSDTSASASLSALDDTDRLRMGDSDVVDGRTSGTPHPYAEGIIRFYRARTVLEGRGAEDTRRAWRYLEQVSPHDLPASARWHYLDLVYFMRETEIDHIDAGEFRARVRAIAQLIDGFVDRLNSETDSR